MMFPRSKAKWAALAIALMNCLRIVPMILILTARRWNPLESFLASPVATRNMAVVWGSFVGWLSER